MNSHLRNVFISVVAALLALKVGIDVAQEDYLLAAATAGFAILVIVTWFSEAVFDTWVLAFLVFGYTIGNRGFAQITPAGGLPLFFGEIGLGATLTLVVIRLSFARQLPIQRNPLNVFLAAWIALGTCRIGFDVFRHGFVALRDFATVYYALFFFVAQAVSSQPASRQMLHRAILATFAVLPVTAALSEAFPEAMMALTFRDIPIILYKDDLVGTFLFAGFLLLIPPAGQTSRLTKLRWVLAVFSLSVGLMQLSRAGMMGLAVGALWQGLAGRWRPARTIAATMFAGALGLAVLGQFKDSDVSQTKAFGVYEQVISIFDVSGTGSYRHSETADSGDNNRFRIVWWQTIAADTMREGPLFGLGFGHDLARNFLQVYNPLEEDFTARSPHSILFTTLGRMGLIGLLVLMAVYFLVAVETRKVVRWVRRGDAPASLLTLLSACWVILVSSCFGVVLEGPMGAIPLWIMLGLACYQARALNADAATPAEAADAPRDFAQRTRELTAASTPPGGR